MRDQRPETSPSTTLRTGTERSRSARNQKKIQGLLFVLSGPSGSGKTTILKQLLQDKQLEKKLVHSVSLTTRPKRGGERNSRHYFFISQKQFQKLRQGKKILEWTRYLGYYYATPKEFVERKLAQGKNLLFCLDIKGAFRLKQLYPDSTITIFIKPPSLKILQRRIKNRCEKTKIAEIKQRLMLAKKEFKQAHRYDYCLVNQDLKNVTKELKDIILKYIK